MAFHTILVPLDGSPLGERALPYVTTLACLSNTRLVLVHAARDAVSRRQAEESLAQIAEELWQHGVPVEAHVRCENAGPMILQAAETWEADLVAMSTHGRSGVGRWLYGSVADDVLRHSAAPVLLVPAQCERTWRGAPGGAIAAAPSRVLLPLDGSRRAEAALGPASTLAATLGARLHLVRVVPPPLSASGEVIADGLPPYSAYPAGESRPLEGAIRPLGTYRRPAPGSWDAWASGLGEQLPLQAEPVDTTDLEQASRYLDRLAPEIEAEGMAVDIDAVVGRPAPEIITLAERHDVDAIAMATHGRSGVARLTLGSVATEVLQRAQVPLLLVGPAAVAWMVPATGPEAEVADRADRPDQAIPAAGRE